MAKTFKTRSKHLNTKEALEAALTILSSMKINEFLTDEEKQSRHNILQAYNRMSDKC